MDQAPLKRAFYVSQPTETDVLCQWSKATFTRSNPQSRRMWTNNFKAHISPDADLVEST